MHPGQPARSTLNFDAIADDQYDESIPRHVMEHLTRRRARLITEAAASGKVLDVGCGTGTLLSSLTRDDYERFGVDLSSGMLRRALAKDRRLECCVASATCLPYRDEAFDVVFSAAVLHHIAQPRAVAVAIRELVRVTRVGGTAIIWDHNPLNPYWPILMRRSPQDIGEERLISRREIDADLRVLGSDYEIRVRWRQMTFLPEFTPSVLIPVLATVERALEIVPIVSMMSAHNIAIVEKLAKRAGEAPVGAPAATGEVKYVGR